LVVGLWEIYQYVDLIEKRLFIIGISKPLRREPCAGVLRDQPAKQLLVRCEFTDKQAEVREKILLHMERPVVPGTPVSIEYGDPRM
jgi:hypothetical protein